MHFDNFEPIEHRPSTLYNVIFEIRFPDILRIASELPVLFQDSVMKEGYTEFEQGSTSNLTGRVENYLPDDFRAFHFFTEQGDWHCVLSRNSLGLHCLANYMNSSDFRQKLEKILQIFCKIYTVPYFTRVGIKHDNMANSVFLPNLQVDLQSFIPEYIFPLLKTSVANDILNLQTQSVFDDGEIRAIVTHSLLQVSGIFAQKQVSNELSYVVEADCFYEQKIGVRIDEILSKYDRLHELWWNIFQWSITEDLRTVITETSNV